jgi:sterol desaturase/sphingolipid hydroxylase (fatty acid hydroxylase superfamily)
MLQNSAPPTLLDQTFNISILHSEAVPAFLIVFFVLFSALECRFPKDKVPANKIRDAYKANIGLLVFNSVVLSLLSASKLLALAQHYSSQWLFNHLPSPALQMLVSFLLYDLSLYAWHWASHRCGFLWQFHKVHHSANHVNVSTAFRLHLLDVMVITLIKAAYIIVFGFDVAVVLANEAINAVFLMFHHSNLSFKGERLLGYLIIVPYLHRTHHSMQRHEHGNNYGAVLSIWDRLFGTLVELDTLEVGIKETVPQDLIGMIKFGFQVNSPLPIQHLSLDVLETMIAEAAYFKAEKRSLYPGHEIRDWLEAKKDIFRQVYGDKTNVIKKRNKTQIYAKGRICF